MSSLRDAADDYLTMRRALGYKLEIHGQHLENFISHLEGVNAQTVTIENAVAWATLPAGGDPGYWAGRLSAAVRAPSPDDRPCLRGSARTPAAISPAASDPVPL
jgi:integrase/recombinase XerD